MNFENFKDSAILPPKRLCETMSSSTVGSKCGEIFVTNNADKWTFFCSYCQKVTNDIGVFICHIRLDHLSCMQDFQLQKENIESIPELEGKLTNIPVTSRHGEEKAENNFVKEEILDSNTICSRVSKIVDISPLTDNSGTEELICNKNPISTSYLSPKIKEEVFTIIPGDGCQETKQQDFHSAQEDIKIIRNNNAYENNNAMNGNKDVIDLDTSSIYSTNDGYDEDDANANIVDFEGNDDNKASCSKHIQETRLNMKYQCEYCDMNFKFRSYLDDHLKKLHKLKLNEIPLKCKHCKKFFRSVSGLKCHLKAHDQKTHLQCPICQATHKQNYFISHVLTHESDNCFPCQSCGKIYTSNEERMEHWETHANEMPYSCDFCFRRFRKSQYLTHHLKSHFQYQCQFCPTQFNAIESQKPPYVCTTCANLPDLKRRIQHRKVLGNKYQAYDSD